MESFKVRNSGIRYYFYDLPRPFPLAGIKNKLEQEKKIVGNIRIEQIQDLKILNLSEGFFVDGDKQIDIARFIIAPNEMEILVFGNSKDAEKVEEYIRSILPKDILEESEIRRSIGTEADVSDSIELSALLKNDILEEFKQQLSIHTKLNIKEAKKEVYPTEIRFEVSPELTPEILKDYVKKPLRVDIQVLRIFFKDFEHYKKGVLSVFANLKDEEIKDILISLEKKIKGS